MSDSPPLVRPDSSRHAISVLIVTAAILWNVAALARVHYAPTSWREFPSQFVFALAFGQIGLAAGYVVWGRLNLAVRIALLLAVAVASSRLTALADRSGATTGWLAIHLAMALISIAALSMSRLGGLSLVHPDLRQSLPRRWQFSLLSLVSVMTSVALVAAVWRWATLPWSESSQTWWAIAHILAAETAITCICLIVPLAAGAWWKGAGIAIAGTFAITFTFFWLSQSKQSTREHEHAFRPADCLGRHVAANWRLST
jgi:hypothetical protein